MVDCGDSVDILRLVIEDSLRILVTLKKRRNAQTDKTLNSKFNLDNIRTVSGP